MGSAASILAGAKDTLADANKKFPSPAPAAVSKPQQQHEYSSAPYKMAHDAIKKVGDVVNSVKNDDTAAGLKARKDNVDAYEKAYGDPTK